MLNADGSYVGTEEDISGVAAKKEEQVEEKGSSSSPPAKWPTMTTEEAMDQQDIAAGLDTTVNPPRPWPPSLGASGGFVGAAVRPIFP